MYKYLLALIVLALAVEVFLLLNKDASTEVGVPVEPATKVVVEGEEQAALVAEEVVVGEMVVENEVELPPVSEPIEESPQEPVEELVTKPIEVVKESVAATDLLSVGKVPQVVRVTVSLSAAEEPARIPFKLFTRVPETDLGKYQLCYTILDDGVRASETDCSILTENYSLDTRIALTSLNLAPLTLDPASGYMSVGTHKIEIVVALIASNVSVSGQITSDTSPDLGILFDNAVMVGRTGQFNYIVTE